MEIGMKSCTFLWFIENYSYCWLEPEDKLISPEFTAEGLEGTSWTLQLYQKRRDKRNFSLFLRRSQDDGPDIVWVSYQMSFLSENGETLSKLDYRDWTFRKGDKNGRTIYNLRVIGKEKFLPKDTLHIKCYILLGGGTRQPAELQARTRIEIKQVLFLHVTESFSTLEPNEKKTMQFRLATEKGFALFCSLYLSDCSCCDEKILVAIMPSDANYKLSKCKLFIVDKSEKKIDCGEVDNRLDANGKTVQVLALSLTWKDILQRKNELLPDDKLSLSYECSFFTGEEYGEIERIVLENPLASITDKTYYQDTIKVPIKGITDSVCRDEVKIPKGPITVTEDTNESVYYDELILKCVCVAIFSCFFGIFVSYLWGDEMGSISTF